MIDSKKYMELTKQMDDEEGASLRRDQAVELKRCRSWQSEMSDDVGVPLHGEI